MVWNPVTNAVKTYPASDKLTLYGSYTPSNDGKSLLYQSSNSISYKINTTTGEIKELAARVSVPAGYAALKNDGLIYFTDSYQNQLKRLNLDGTITGFLEFNTLNGIIGFDRTNDQYLWVTLQNGVAKIDLSANTMTRINLDSINAKVLLSDGGIGVLTSEPSSGGSGEQRYLTVIR